jgi:hypothetical protein
MVVVVNTRLDVTREHKKDVVARQPETSPAYSNQSRRQSCETQASKDRTSHTENPI